MKLCHNNKELRLPQLVLRRNKTSIHSTLVYYQKLSTLGNLITGYFFARHSFCNHKNFHKDVNVSDIAWLMCMRRL